jgi:hypothetical protein
MLYGIKSVYAVTGIWMIPIIFFNEEVRKLIIRNNPKGCMARLTSF